MKTGKAGALLRLKRAGFPVPPFFVIAPSQQLDRSALTRAAARLLGPADLTLAVRSSASGEDGASRSFAGMFATKLFVNPADVAEAVEAVRESADGERLRVYGRSSGAFDVIVQRMVDADVAGVAFARDPIDGSDAVVIDAANGVGTAVVDGELDPDRYRVAPDGTVRSNGREALLTDAQAREIASLVRRASTLFKRPQDVEWALCGGRVFILQSRPITTCDEIVWDNSNISESYDGLVLPLTYSFISSAYEGAYRQALATVGVPTSQIESVREQLENMLGLIDGRVYYNLLSWYRLLALVPGFSHNRRFMESMMGVREPLPEGMLAAMRRRGGLRTVVGVARMTALLAWRCARLSSDVRTFHRTLGETLAERKVEEMNLDQLGREYARLETALLHEWDVPLVNDFFAALFYGVLRALCTNWLRSDNVHNDLLCAEGDMISTLPASTLDEIGLALRARPETIDALATGDCAGIETALQAQPAIRTMIGRYLERFGERVQNELKLETKTLRDDPLPLYRALAAIARSDAGLRADAGGVRAEAEDRVARAFAGRPFRRMLFRFVLENARARVRDRENLRFERTRVFARVRRIMNAAGARLAADGALAEADDIFYLHLCDVRAAMRGEALGYLRERVSAERARYAAFAQLSDPPNRFASRSTRYDRPLREECEAMPSTVIRGTACSPGVARGRVRIVRDVSEGLSTGEILVARRTDPGWVILFPLAAGILVERGSLLSHAAIVSREMGIPSIVSLPGLTGWLKTGDLIEFDGSTGEVRLLERAA